MIEQLLYPGVYFMLSSSLRMVVVIMFHNQDFKIVLLRSLQLVNSVASLPVRHTQASL